MALVPKINFCINNKCDKIDIYEETGPYHATNNPEGWVNSGSVATNIDTSEITSADVKFYDYTGNTLQLTVVMYDGTTDVYSGVTGAPAPGAFLAIDDQAWSLADGIWKVVYTVTDGVTTFTNDAQWVLFTCNVDNCLDKLKGFIITECDAKKLIKQKETLDQLEVLLYGIKSAYSCGDLETATNRLAEAKTICDNMCDCGCGDC
jgi:hypothetical protein